MSEHFPSPSDSKKLIVLHLGKDLACVSVGSYQVNHSIFTFCPVLTSLDQEAVDIAIYEYYSELKDISRDHIQLRVNIAFLDGTSQVARLTESGFNDTLAQFKPMKLVTIHITPKSAAETVREPPKYQPN
ncbi:hypothetical protein GYMLUDRAFT_60834 [Collybiopsis luxurians FD-317 M1]|uniref:Uncharacterized protein n=1 Tax=Collybiopsis luxurians FD-317 M1 TaxID=944289 RepID=A0A0D0B4P5_9AGAR|nr:hypothetical protein GYMLUDRAFT_60834 [Collybiopsis luxurians FD-317 M1]